MIAHECGHNAFSDNRFIQDAVGYALHSVLLVPYFSWQRSHAVHHSRTNHLTEGETHVPYVKGEIKGDLNLKAKASMGEGPFAILQLVTHLVFGWPAYLLTGATGGSARGVTNHFLPNVNTGDLELFPGSWKKKVYYSDVGVFAFVGVLAAWIANSGWAPLNRPLLGPLFVCQLLARLVHVVATHRRRRPTLGGERVVVHQGCLLDDRPPVRPGV